MPAHNYDRIPHDEESGLPLSHLDPSYYAGPGTAPPSFQSHEESGGSATPPATSVWAPSEATPELETVKREGQSAIARLTERMETLEGKVEAHVDMPTKEREAFEDRRRERRRKEWIFIGTWVGGSIFCLWVMAMLTILVCAAYRRAGIK